MSSTLDKQINKCLKDMHTQSSTGKGSYGEQAVFKICEGFYQTNGGILYHSYSYKTDPEKAGNIKKANDGHLFVENLGNMTEIDVLYISKHRVYPIEVKAYKAKQITLTDDGIEGCYKTDKSPVHQNEMHCRHMYSGLYRALPNGNTDYVIPIVCFVDKCKVIDKRSPAQKKYIYCTVLNNLRKFIKSMDKPGEFDLDLDTIDNVLNEMMFECCKHLPVRR